MAQDAGVQDARVQNAGVWDAGMWDAGVQNTASQEMQWGCTPGRDTLLECISDSKPGASFLSRANW